MSSDLRYVGNFDNSGGLGLLRKVIIDFREKIDRDITDIERGWNLSDGDDAEFIVTLHLYAVMVERYKVNAAPVPKPQTIRHWRDVYMPAFDQFCEQAGADDWCDKRRAVIRDVFAHFEKVATSVYPDDKEG